ncbi:hypothetical protein CWS72_09895 [Telmatospirillum siberiense]|uniref:Uncharacterized protein n=1 Tax=Telmatospirillum siberiense TaxID=382514 RepID=A0A2N3PW80_9PROT|nr:hypothetical protein CWS72_09895 [Telmatospirillum siberiense]
MKNVLSREDPFAPQPFEAPHGAADGQRQNAKPAPPRLPRSAIVCGRRTRHPPIRWGNVGDFRLSQGAASDRYSAWQEELSAAGIQEFVNRKLVRVASIDASA